MIRTIKEEEIALAEHRDVAEALAQIGQCIDDVFQLKRIHSALGYLTPEEFETQWLQKRPNAMAVKLESPQNGPKL